MVAGIFHGEQDPGRRKDVDSEAEASGPGTYGRLALRRKKHGWMQEGQVGDAMEKWGSKSPARGVAFGRVVGEWKLSRTGR